MLRWASVVEKSPTPPAAGTKNWLLPMKSRMESAIAAKESAVAAKGEEEVVTAVAAAAHMRLSPTMEV